MSIERLEKQLDVTKDTIVELSETLCEIQDHCVPGANMHDMARWQALEDFDKEVSSVLRGVVKISEKLNTLAQFEFPN